VAEAFIANHSQYFKCDENYSAIREYLDERQLEFTSDNLHTAFTALAHNGQLEMRPGHARNLDQTEQLHIISLCKNGQLEDAMGQYLDYALPNASDHWTDTTSFLSDPDSLAVRNKACYFVWWHSRSAEDSPDWREFSKKYFRLRPIHTVSDYDNCYAAFEVAEKALFRDKMIHEEPQPQREDLDQLTDAQVDNLTHQTLQARYRQINQARRGSRA
jgi:hypothetical protein